MFSVLLTSWSWVPKCAARLFPEPAESIPHPSLTASQVASTLQSSRLKLFVYFSSHCVGSHWQVFNRNTGCGSEGHRKSVWDGMWDKTQKLPFWWDTVSHPYKVTDSLEHSHNWETSSNSPSQNCPFVAGTQMFITVLTRSRNYFLS